jgi:hypothetical protein
MEATVQLAYRDCMSFREELSNTHTTPCRITYDAASMRITLGHRKMSRRLPNAARVRETPTLLAISFGGLGTRSGESVMDEPSRKFGPRARPQWRYLGGVPTSSRRSEDRVA